MARIEDYKDYEIHYIDDRETWERSVFAVKIGERIYCPYVLHADSKDWGKELNEAIAYLKNQIDKKEKEENNKE